MIDIRKLNPLQLPKLVRRTLNREKPPQKQPALPPGTLIHVGEQKTDRMTIRAIEYSSDEVTVAEPDSVSECLRFRQTQPVSWIQVIGLHEVEKIAELGKAFDVHPLVLEDIVNTRGRSKVEVFDDYIFVQASIIAMDEKSSEVHSQRFALILLENTVVTFQEEPTTILDPVIQRIKSGGGGRIRKAGADYLAWAITDAIVDNYFGVIEALDDAVADLDDRLQTDAAGVDGALVYSTRREVTGLYRLVRPLREIASGLHRCESKLLTKQSEPFYRDLYDHAIHAIEETEDLRDLTSGLRDFYLSAVSNRMNEIMKVLTCFSTIFLPLTFLAGIYGMNFEHIPELKWSWGYPALWIAFAIIALCMVALFRRKRWL